MMREQPRNFYDGLPNYVQAYIRQEYEVSRHTGQVEKEYDYFVVQILKKIFKPTDVRATSID
jgi:hypothetical protein